MSNTLEYELAELIIDFCNVEDVSPRDIPLDAVEVVVAVQKTYGVRIGGEKTSREVLQSLTALANFIRQEKGESL